MAVAGVYAIFIISKCWSQTFVHLGHIQETSTVLLLIIIISSNNNNENKNIMQYNIIKTITIIINNNNNNIMDLNDQRRLTETQKNYVDKLKKQKQIIIFETLDPVELCFCHHLVMIWSVWLIFSVYRSGTELANSFPTTAGKSTVCLCWNVHPKKKNPTEGGAVRWRG